LRSKPRREANGHDPRTGHRQANDQPRRLRADRHQEGPPPVGATIMVSPGPAVDPDGALSAELHVHVVSPEPAKGQDDEFLVTLGAVAAADMLDRADERGLNDARGGC
jgi:hypothetical protein